MRLDQLLPDERALLNTLDSYGCEPNLSLLAHIKTLDEREQALRTLQREYKIAADEARQNLP